MGARHEHAVGRDGADAEEGSAVALRGVEDRVDLVHHNKVNGVPGREGLDLMRTQLRDARAPDACQVARRQRSHVPPQLAQSALLAYERRVEATRSRASPCHASSRHEESQPSGAQDTHVTNTPRNVV